MVTMRKQLVSTATANSKSYGRTNKKTHLTIHMTANKSKGANAQAHANLQTNGNVRQASWHWQVDDKQAIQSYDHSWSCWHAGVANTKSIAIEICVNSDGDLNKAIANAVELAAHILKTENIPVSNMVTHKHWTGKDCPRELLPHWSKFVADVKAELAPKPVKTASNNEIGIFTVTSKSLNLRASKSLNAKVLKQLPKGSSWKCNKVEGHWFRLGNGWVSNPRNAYGKFVPTKIHTVKSGETLWGIANKHGLTVAQLKSKNGLRTNTIQIGMKLFV